MRPFDGAEDLAKRAEVEQHEMTLLAAADALMSLAGTGGSRCGRRRAALGAAVAEARAS